MRQQAPVVIMAPEVARVEVFGSQQRKYKGQGLLRQMVAEVVTGTAVPVAVVA